jgi:hypothetical protein
MGCEIFTTTLIFIPDHYCPTAPGVALPAKNTPFTHLGE